MLAQSEMAVVIALEEKITLGTQECVTAEELSRRGDSPRCHRDELLGDKKMKRGKPHKRETQIW